MKPYIIIYERSNGYNCGCCRRTWSETDTMEFENNDSAKAFAENYKVEDTEVTSIYELADINPVI